MKIYFTLDKNNHLSSYSYSPMQIAENEIQYETETDIELFELRYYDYINGELIYNNIYENEELIRQIRSKRERYCFPIVNRGALWYNTLTQEQIKELDIWYKAWLDATETLVIPEAPEWLE